MGNRESKMPRDAQHLGAFSFRVPALLRFPTMKVFGTHDPATLAQLEDVRSRAVDAALMADGHVGYVMPIGGVAAYDEQVSVVGVGFDIACGNAAIRTDLTLHGTSGLAGRLPAIADEIQDAVSFGMGRKNRANDAPLD